MGNVLNLSLTSLLLQNLCCNLLFVTRWTCSYFCTHFNNALSCLFSVWPFTWNGLHVHLVKGHSQWLAFRHSLLKTVLLLGLGWKCLRVDFLKEWRVLYKCSKWMNEWMDEWMSAVLFFNKDVPVYVVWPHCDAQCGLYCMGDVYRVI